MNKNTNNYDTFKSIIFEADKIVDVRKRSQNISAQCVSLYKNPENIIDEKEKIQFGVFLKVLNNETVEYPLLFFSVAQKKSLCNKLHYNQNNIAKELAKFEYERAQKLIDYAKSSQIKKYTDRHRLVERAMMCMIPYAQDKEQWIDNEIPTTKLFDFIASCYLLRSRLALQKGSTIPEKKLEAIKKALEWSDKGNDPNLNIEIVLEKNRWDTHTDQKWLMDRIQSYLGQTKITFTLPIHWTVCNTARLLGIDFHSNIDEQMLQHPFNIVQDESHYYPLYQAEAAFRLKNKKVFYDKISFAVKHLHEHLGNPLWQDILSLIKKASQDDLFTDAWEEAAIHAWRKCKIAESKLKLSIQVRWYWSKSKELYDLAFLAAIQLKKPKLALTIADSQKNRPTIKFQHIEKHFTDEKDLEVIHKYLEADALFATYNFSAGMEQLKKMLPLDRKQKYRSLLNIPKNLAAVHFYVINYDCAYAIIVQNKQIECMNIPIEEAWDTFQVWDHDRKNMDFNSAKNTLEKLCIACGNMLSPIIEKINHDHILFIPHGFLHLSPLHAAKINDTYLFETHQCFFLPSWSIAPINTTQLTEKHRNVFISNYKKDLVIEELVNQQWDNEKTKKNTPTEALEIINTNQPLGLLVLFCHGEGEYVNPYQSRLLLANEPLTHHEIIQKLKERSLTGTKVMLTACETDLVNRKFDIVDEHLSLSNAFLRKGASEILGTLFECTDTMSVELVNKVRTNSDSAISLCEILHEQQKQWLENGRSIIDICAYRITGLK